MTLPLILINKIKKLLKKPLKCPGCKKKIGQKTIDDAKCEHCSKYLPMYLCKNCRGWYPENAFVLERQRCKTCVELEEILENNPKLNSENLEEIVAHYRRV